MRKSTNPTASKKGTATKMSGLFDEKGGRSFKSPSSRDEWKPYAIIAAKVYALWNVMMWKLSANEKVGVVNRIKHLISAGISEHDILNAVNNYAISEWHIANEAWKKPLYFLTEDSVRRWQKTANEQYEQKRSNYENLVNKKREEVTDAAISSILKSF